MSRELWDLYNSEGVKLNKTVYRGDKLKDDEFHIVVNSWVKNKDDKFLITQRIETKSFPLTWECTGGSGLSGETPLESAIREVKEELGIRVYKKDAKLIGKTLRYYQGCPDILYVYLFETNEENITIQKEEVNDYKWATKEEILELYKNNKFSANAFFLDVIFNK